MAKKAILVAVALTVAVVGYYLATDDAPVREGMRTDARTIEEKRRARAPEPEPDEPTSERPVGKKLAPANVETVERVIVDERGNPVPFVRIVTVKPTDFVRAQFHVADANGKVKVPKSARVAIVSYKGVRPEDFGDLRFRGIAGRLLDEDNNPVTRGLILVRREGKEKILAYTSLRPGGRFAIFGLEEGQYWLTYKTSRSGVETTTIDGGRDVPHWQTGVELRMLRGDTIEGIVFDENGVPKKHVWVRTTIGTTLTGATTNEEGRFVVKGVDPQTVYRLTTWMRGYVPEIREGIRPGTRDLTFTLDPGQRSTGRVLDAAGKPLAKTQMKVRPKSGRAIPLYPATDAEGNFDMRGLPDEEIAVTINGQTFTFRAGDRDLVFALK